MPADPARTQASTLSLHDALPICSSFGGAGEGHGRSSRKEPRLRTRLTGGWAASPWTATATSPWATASPARRSEEHTSELQSQANIVCRLLLERKKLRASKTEPLL